MSTPRFFATPEDFRAWLEMHHGSAQELVVGYWKKATGKPSVTWEETVDEALCYGWIDGVRRSLDGEAFTVRFTPRREGSIWSQRNLDRVDVLCREGRMKPAGLAIWEARRSDRSGYSVDTMPSEFPPDMRERFGAAWAFHAAQPAGYRRTVVQWVVSAKKEETKDRRLRAVIAAAANEARVDLQQPFAHLND